jgi:regulator of sirC expression with transglutaminase-like and TPR domain
VAATLGQPEVARQALRRYLQLTPNAPDAAQIAARIQALGKP